MMSLPGAKMSTQLPLLLKPDLLSVEVVAPTVMACSTVCNLALAPRLALMIAGLSPFRATQSMASMNQAKLPEPSSPRTLTAWNVAFLATPYFLPPMLPAQCVPWPLTLSKAQDVSEGL